MSLNRVVVVSSAIHMNGKSSEIYETHGPSNLPPVQPIHGVNVVLGGAMMSGIIIMIFFICYCCHRNQNKRQNGNAPMYWRDPGLNVDIYTIEAHSHHHQQLHEMQEDIPSPRHANHGPPPTYAEAVIVECENKTNIEHVVEEHQEPPSNEGLPTYEAALQLAHNEGHNI